MWVRLYFPRVTRLLNLTAPKYVAMMDEAVGNFLGVMEVSIFQPDILTF
jgi:hypothetical protein